MTIKKDQQIAKILGISLNSTQAFEVLENISSRLAKKQKTFIVTPNPEFLVYGRQHLWFGRLLNSADLAIPDGMGLVWAAKILGQPIGSRVSGADLAKDLLRLAKLNCWSVGVVGARHGVAVERCRLISRLNAKYHPAKILGLEDTPDWSKKSLELIFACQGMGKQEKWISEHFKQSAGIVFMGAGGSLDYLAGFVRRAPVWVRRLGLEWLYRLVRQPWRLRRQLNLIKFVWLVVKEKFAP